MSSSEINESLNFTYINTLVNDFYKYMGEAYIEYKNKNNDNVIANNSINTMEIDITKIQIEDIKDTEKPITQSFSDYFLFKLFYNYGIKRRMVNEHIALLYYAKNLVGYKPRESITILCRHMLLDTSIMRIISLGIPKAIKLDIFCKNYDIDNTNVETNFITNGIDEKDEKTDLDLELELKSVSLPKFRVYKFSEGTMLTYNPSLKKYCITVINTNSDDDEMDIVDNEKLNIDKSTQELLSNNIEIKFNKQFMYSTRKVVGTGSFSSLKTFFEMFEENNNIANTNLDNIPEEFMKDKVLVFNIEHPENRIISSQLRNFNTLCAVFQFKNESIVQEQFNKIMQIEYLVDNQSEKQSEVKSLILESFKELGNNMITQIQVSSFKKQVKEFNVNLHLPEIIKSFEKLESDGITKTTININDLSIEKIEEIVQNKPKDFQGYIIYGLNGERTKILNNKYKELRSLKGNKPIVIEQWNTKNLFYLYWRLVKEKKIEEFIKEFDINQSNSIINNDYMYTKLFNWFLYIVKTYSQNLFKTYHNAFVKKSFNKSLIPFSMKPMCGDLHTNYLKDKVPITPLMVEKYIFEQPVSKMFWRIFLDNKN
jgi:hypothetical protein